MPPKRRPPAEAPKDADDGSKKAKVDEPPTASASASAAAPAASGHASLTGSGVQGIPDCIYGAKCYRKNPQHFKEFNHPTGVSVPPPAAATTLARVNSISKKDFAADLKQKPENQKSDAGPELEAYKLMLKTILSKPRITPDEKKLCRTYCNEHSIDKAQHQNILSQFGWSQDEWEDGEKVDDDIDLQEERAVLNDAGGYKIITITKDQKKTKEQEHVFAKVAARFFQTMSKAQANYQVSAVGVIVNSGCKQKFESKRKEFQMSKKDTNEEWGFHGTSVESITGISKTGFLHPDELAGATDKKKGKGKGKTAGLPKVVLLDDGYFGKGIYFSFFSDYAMWYSEERESDKLLLCKLIRGKCYKVDKRDDGVGLKPGYDSHYSPGGNEIVIFDPAMILPRYVVTFSSQDAQERDQEG